MTSTFTFPPHDLLPYSQSFTYEWVEEGLLIDAVSFGRVLMQRECDPSKDLESKESVLTFANMQSLLDRVDLFQTCTGWQFVMYEYPKQRLLIELATRPKKRKRELSDVSPPRPSVVPESIANDPSPPDPSAVLESARRLSPRDPSVVLRREKPKSRNRVFDPEETKRPHAPRNNRRQPLVIIPWETPPLHNTCALDCVLMALYCSIARMEDPRIPSKLQEVFQLLQKQEYLASKQMCASVCGFTPEDLDYFEHVDHFLNPLFSEDFFAFRRTEVWVCDEKCATREDVYTHLQSRPQDVWHTLKSLQRGHIRDEECVTCRQRAIVSAHVTTAPTFSWLWVDTSGEKMDASVMANLSETVSWFDRTFRLCAIMWYHRDPNTRKKYRGDHNLAYIHIDAAHFQTDKENGWYQYDGRCVNDAKRFVRLQDFKKVTRTNEHLTMVGLVYAAE